MKNPLKLQYVEYDKLSPKQKEIYNFQKVASILADYGFNCIKLADDWKGADFLAYHKDGDQTLKVQLKSGMGIYKKFIGKHLYMCFPIGKMGHLRIWYLIPHDKLVEIVRKVTPNALRTKAWCEKGFYTWPDPPPKALRERLSGFARRSKYSCEL